MTVWDSHRNVCRSVLDTIGRTPLVPLRAIPSGSAEILVKIEYFSPSGSLKDRIYAAMFEKAEARGQLRPGKVVLECSTGNAGIACAFLGAVKGYPVVVVMPEGMSEERKKIISSYGAELVFTPGGESDVDLALEKLEEIRRQDPERYFVPWQFDNPDNIEAHFSTTGPELWEQVGGSLDAFVAAQGSGGTLSGVGRYLRQQGASTRLFAAEPAECPLLVERRWGAHAIEGIGDGFVPRNLDLSILDGVVTVSSREAMEMARRLSREEGILCGTSSGANVAAALKLTRALEGVRRVATLINDTGERYFSTALFGEEKELQVPERDHRLDPYTVEQLDRYQAGWTVVR